MLSTMILNISENHDSEYFWRMCTRGCTNMQKSFFIFPTYMILNISENHDSEYFWRMYTWLFWRNFKQKNYRWNGQITCLLRWRDEYIIYNDSQYFSIKLYRSLLQKSPIKEMIFYIYYGVATILNISEACTRVAFAGENGRSFSCFAGKPFWFTGLFSHM